MQQIQWDEIKQEIFYFKYLLVSLESDYKFLQGAQKKNKAYDNLN